MRSSGTLIVGTDFSELSDIGLRAAIAVGEKMGASKLHLISVLKLAPHWGAVTPYSMSQHNIDSLAKRALEATNAHMKAYETPKTRMAVTREIRPGSPARELALAAEDLGAELLVIASHGRGATGRLILGSVASNVIRTAHCPVLVVGEGREGARGFRSIVAAVDLSPMSGEVLEHAVTWGSVWGAPVKALSVLERTYVVAGPEERLGSGYITEQEIAGLRQAQQESLDKLIQAHARPEVDIVGEISTETPPAVAILDRIRRSAPDLLVIGTSGHHAIHRMIVGSTAGRVVAEAPCPVLVIPPPATA